MYLHDPARHCQQTEYDIQIAATRLRVCLRKTAIFKSQYWPAFIEYVTAENHAIFMAVDGWYRSPVAVIWMLMHLFVNCLAAESLEILAGATFVKIASLRFSAIRGDDAKNTINVLDTGRASQGKSLCLLGQTVYWNGFLNKPGKYLMIKRKSSAYRVLLFAVVENVRIVGYVLTIDGMLHREFLYKLI